MHVELWGAIWRGGDLRHGEAGRQRHGWEHQLHRVCPDADPGRDRRTP